MTDVAATVDSPILPTAECFDFELLLVQAAAERRTGRIVIERDGGEFGQVFIHGGRVAWATCVDQGENLGTFLARLGHLRDEQLAELRQEHSRRKGACKLGELLVESGVITRTRLLSCLKLHLRMAIARLLQIPRLTAVLVADPRSSNESMSFPLSQLVPSWWQLQAPPGAGGQADDACAQAACLGSLNDVPGFLGALVLDSDGEAIAQCGFTGAAADHAPRVACWIGALLGDDVELPGGAESGFVEGAWGTLVARRIEGADGLSVAVLLGPEGKPGTALHRLSSITPALLSAFSEAQEGAS